MVGLRFGKTIGLFGQGDEIALETMRDALPAMQSAADKLVARTQEKLSVRMDGPSEPGEPPAMHEGMLKDGMGRSQGFANAKAAAVVWGFGVGPDAQARIAAHAARRGEEVGDMYAIANMNEYGSVNYELARTHPQRSFVRSTEQELQAEVVREIEAAYL